MEYLVTKPTKLFLTVLQKDTLTPWLFSYKSSSVWFSWEFRCPVAVLHMSFIREECEGMETFSINQYNKNKKILRSVLISNLI